MARSTNKILSALTDADYDILASFLEPVELRHRMVLEESNVPVEYIYFPASGVASVIAVSSGGERVEVGLFGQEGMSGLCVVNGSDRTPLMTIMQVAGEGVRIARASFETALANSSLKDVFLLFNQAYTIQMAHTALSNGRHTIDERLARWLLMSHDRIGSDDLPLTHEFLSVMLGVRRAGVTTGLHVLEGAQAIRATRGLVQVRDRAKLEAFAGDAYGLPEAEYRRLFSTNVMIDGKADGAGKQGSSGVAATRDL